MQISYRIRIHSLAMMFALICALLLLSPYESSAAPLTPLSLAKVTPKCAILITVNQQTGETGLTEIALDNQLIKAPSEVIENIVAITQCNLDTQYLCPNGSVANHADQCSQCLTNNSKDGCNSCCAEETRKSNGSLDGPAADLCCVFQCGMSQSCTHWVLYRFLKGITKTAWNQKFSASYEKAHSSEEEKKYLTKTFGVIVSPHE